MKFKPLSILITTAIGSVLGGAYGIWRTTDWSTDILQDIHPRPKYWIGWCEDLPPHYRRLIIEISPYVPPTLKQNFREIVERTIAEIDQIMVIEQQCQFGEVEPQYSDYADAEWWASSVMRQLRQLEIFFQPRTTGAPIPQIAYDVHKLVDLIGSILMRHLNNIHLLVRQFQLEHNQKKWQVQQQKQSAILPPT